MANDFDPLYGLTREALEAQGVDVDAWVEQQTAHHGQQAAHHAQEQLAEAAGLVTAAQDAVASGEATYAEVAAAFLSGGHTAAHDMLLAAWQAEDAAERVSMTASDLTFADADTWAAHVEEMRAEETDRVEQQLRRKNDELARAKLDQVGEHLRDWVHTTPGAHESAADVEARVKQIILDEQGIPDSDEGKERLIAQAIHDVTIRDNLTAGLVEKVDADWRAYKRYGGSQSQYMKDTNGGIAFAADADEYERQWKEKRLRQVGEATRVDPKIREIPPTAEEEAAEQAEKYRQRQAVSTSFHQQVAGIAERGQDAQAGRDRGEAMSQDKRAYREALQRAEGTAAYGEFAGVRSGYGDNPVEPEKQSDRIDEYGGAFPGYE